MRRVLSVVVVVLVLRLGFAEAARIAFFGGYTEPQVADPGFIAHLEAHGHIVTYHMPVPTEGQAQIDLANANDLVIISESIGSSSVSSGPGGTFHLQDVATSVISFEAFMYDEARWTGWTSMVDFGTSGRTTTPGGNSPPGLENLSDTIYIADPVHPLAAGKTGAVVAYTTPYSACFGIVGAGATVVATIDEAGQYPCTFVYPKGALLFDGVTVTPGKRIGIFVGQGGYGSIPDPPGVLQFSYLSEDGLALFDAAVNYALPIPGDVNRDCIVNILDLIVIRGRLNLDVSTGDNWRSDLNEDGRINILDLIFVRGKLNTRCQ